MKCLWECIDIIYICRDTLGHILEMSCLLKHTGGKPHKCGVCEKAFTEAGSSIQRHVRTHTGDKLYECHICGKTFCQSGSLHKHLRTHTSYKPFECDVIGGTFSRAGTLQTHIISVHSDDIKELIY
jgi:zinc finger/BTB domain-containing protein 48